MRPVFALLSAVVIAAAVHVFALAAADPFDTARWNIETRKNEEAIRLIDSGQFDVNMQTSEGYSLLHYAAGAGNLEMVQALLKRGADPTLKADTGTTPYQMAIGTMVQAELRKAMASGKPPAAAPATPAANAAAPRPSLASAGGGMCAMVRAEQVNDGRSIAMRPLLRSIDDVRYNKPDELVGLLDDCVGVNDVDQYGWTLLHHAADRDRLDIARILIQRGASRTLRNKDGKTAPQLATSPEMKALLGAAPAQTRTPAATPSADRSQMCNARHNSSSALCSDTTCKMREYRKWQTCLQTGSYY